jgi:hypothetical protein
MSSLSRRSILGRLAAALPAAAAGGTATAFASPPSAAPPENPRLLKLGRMLEAVEKAAAESWDRMAAAQEQFDAICPAVPNELVLNDGPPYGSKWRDYAEREMNLDYENVSPRRDVISAEHLKHGIASGDLEADRRTRSGKYVRDLVCAAEQYEAAVKEARQAVGADEAHAALSNARCKLGRLARAICWTPAHTGDGIAIKARAMLIQAKYDSRNSDLVGGWWGLPLAKNLLQLEGGASS